MNETSLAPAPSGQIEAVTKGTQLTPAVDIFENEKEYLVRADLPGVSQQAIKVNVEQDRLELRAAMALKPKGGLVTREFHVGNYQRTFRIPEAVERDKIAAKFDNGLLTVRIPKSAKVVPRHIPVSTGR